MRIKYLDVLKFFAILAVVLYHAGLLNYGYLGVDLFLVINGFFVTRKLKNELSTKDKIINKLREEKDNLKTQLQKFKVFWNSIMSHFHKRICYDRDDNYKIVSEDLHKHGIFSDDENEIANNIYKKVKLPDDNKTKKKNDYNLN